MAHDIRGPVGALQFVLEELAIDGDRATRSAELLVRSRRSLDRLLRIADRLTRVAELESQDTEFPVERVELGGLLRESIASARVSDPASGVVVEVAAADRPVFVEVDAARLVTAVGDVLRTYLLRARGRVVVRVELSPARLIIDHDGVRTAAVTDRFADLPLELLRALVLRHGWQIESEASTSNAQGLIEGGRIGICFLEAMSRGDRIVSSAPATQRQIAAEDLTEDLPK